MANMGINAQARAAAPLRIVGLGDSLMQGYGLPPGGDFPARLQAKLVADGVAVQIVTAGVSGDTSAGGLARLDWSLADHPDGVIVELGSNDALRGQAPEDIEKNLDAILAKLKAANVPVLLAGMKAPRNLGPDYVAKFDALFPRLAKKYGVLFYPFFLDGVATDPKLNQKDGMHPNPQGVEIIVARIEPFVKQLIVKARK